MAAARENRSIPFDELLAFCRADTAGALTLIEGIGGVMVPLDERRTVLDWIVAMGAPALLVTGSYLGALSHTLTAMRALTAERVDVVALIVSESPESTVGLDETVSTLARFVAPVPVVALPRGDVGRAPALASYLNLG
jgi:dethiobiotin synthetase